jgi:hypothetical protein
MGRRSARNCFRAETWREAGGKLQKKGAVSDSLKARQRRACVWRHKLHLQRQQVVQGKTPAMAETPAEEKECAKGRVHDEGEEADMHALFLAAARRPIEPIVNELRAELHAMREVIAVLQARVLATEEACVRRVGELEEKVEATIKREAAARHRAAARACERQLASRRDETVAYRSGMDGDMAALRSALRKMRCDYIEREKRDEAFREAKAVADRGHARANAARAAGDRGEDEAQRHTLRQFAELGSAKFAGSAADVVERFDVITADFRFQRQLDREWRATERAAEQVKREYHAALQAAFQFFLATTQNSSPEGQYSRFADEEFIRAIRFLIFNEDPKVLDTLDFSQLDSDRDFLRCPACRRWSFNFRACDKCVSASACHFSHCACFLEARAEFQRYATSMSQFKVGNHVQYARD